MGKCGCHFQVLLDRIEAVPQLQNAVLSGGLFSTAVKGGRGRETGGDVQADHPNQAYLPRLLLLGARQVTYQAAEHVQGEQAGVEGSVREH